MRDIEFRGKRIDNGQWVYGCINIMQNGNTYIFHYSTQFAVIPETVGQYTGLHDKNGKKIYERDIDGSDVPMVICYEYGAYGLKYSIKDKYFDPNIRWGQLKIIGNIYDNPELLREE